MIKKIVFVLSILIFSFGYSQNIKIEGIVQDTLGNPLEMANIMLVNQATKGMDGYAISNEQGKFQISIKSNTTYQLKVSFIGFQAFNQ